MNFVSFRIAKDDAGKRLDRIVRVFLPELSLGDIYRCIRKGFIRIDGKRGDPADRLEEGQTLFLHPSLAQQAGKQVIRKDSDEVSIRNFILFENDAVLCLNKPSGYTVHGEHSLESLVRTYLSSRLPSSLSFKPGPMHRLDRNTSGLLLFSKSLEGARRFSALLRSRDIEKWYIAVLDGILSSEQIWEDRIARDQDTNISHVTEAEGKPAFTSAIPIAYSSRRTLALCSIRTGRTHQIRVQAAAHGHPLSGDAKYSGTRWEHGYVLHAYRIRLPQADSVLGFRTLTAPFGEKSAFLLQKEFGDVRRAIGKIDAFFL